jgi:DNA-binding MarR family transcriptional regulator
VSDPWLTEEQQRIWRAYLRVESLLPAHLNRQLQASSGLSIAEYAVLVYLSEVPGGRVRPFELGRALNWEQSRLSHQIARMEHRKFVTREQCESDKRGAFIVLTPHGRATIEAAAPGHVAAVRNQVFGRLTPAEADAFGDACAKIAAGLEEAASPQHGCETEAHGDAPTGPPSG